MHLFSLQPMWRKLCVSSASCWTTRCSCWPSSTHWRLRGRSPWGTGGTSPPCSWLLCRYLSQCYSLLIMLVNTPVVIAVEACKPIMSWKNLNNCWAVKVFVFVSSGSDGIRYSGVKTAAGRPDWEKPGEQKPSQTAAEEVRSLLFTLSLTVFSVSGWSHLEY